MILDKRATFLSGVSKLSGLVGAVHRFQLEGRARRA